MRDLVEFTENRTDSNCIPTPSSANSRLVGESWDFQKQRYNKTNNKLREKESGIISEQIIRLSGLKFGLNN